MKNISRFLLTTQDMDDFLDAFGRMAPDHVTGDERYRRLDITRLRDNLLFIKITKSPKTVDEWVSATEEHYLEISRAVEDYNDEWREHRLKAEDYGLSHRVA